MMRGLTRDRRRAWRHELRRLTSTAGSELARRGFQQAQATCRHFRLHPTTLLESDVKHRFSIALSLR